MKKQISTKQDQNKKTQAVVNPQQKKQSHEQSQKLQPKSVINATLSKLSPNTIKLIVLAGVLFITLIAYLPALKNNFVNWDDDWYIIENEFIRNVSAKNVSSILTEFYHGQYSPVTTLVLAINYKMSELKPFSYHLTSVVFHLINTAFVFWLIYVLISRINKEKKQRLKLQGEYNPLNLAVIVSVFFGIHVLQVESVAWVSAQKIVLYTLFFLLSCIAYLYFVQTKSKVYYGIAAVLFTLSFGSKEQAMVLPIMFVAFDFILNRDLKSKQVIIEKIPFFILAIIFGIVSLYSQQNYGAISDRVGYPFTDRIAFAGYSFLAYIAKVLFPTKLGAFYPMPNNLGEPLPSVYWVYPPLALIVAAASLLLLKRNRLLFFGVLIYMINIGLTLQIVSTGRDVIIADRYVYIPAIGIFLMAGIIYEHLKAKGSTIKAIATSVLVILAIASFAGTQQRIKVWYDGITLWTDTQIKYPKAHVAFYNRGNEYSARGKLDSAISDFTNGLPLKPTHVGSYSNRGIAYANQGKYQEALADFNKVIQLDSTYSNVYSNRGNTLSLLGDFEAALADYDKALRQKPDYVDAYFNRGIIRDSVGDYTGAVADFDKVLQLNPQMISAYYNRGSVKVKAGDEVGAKADFAKALELQPKIADESLQLAVAYTSKNDFKNAAQYYTKAIQLKPLNPDAYSGRGAARENMNDMAGALADYTKAIELQPQNDAIYVSRGVAHGKLNRMNEAINDFNKAIALKPANPHGYSNRGLAKMRMGDLRNAIADYSKAIELDKNFVMAYNNRGLALRRLNNEKDAIRDFSKAIELSTNFADAYYNRALSYIATGATAKACDDFLKAAQLGIPEANNDIQRYCGK